MPPAKPRGHPSKLFPAYGSDETDRHMRTIVAGSRGVTRQEDVDWAMELAQEVAGFVVTEVVSGTAAGADTLGERWAEREGIPVKRFPADWGNVEGKPEREIGRNARSGPGTVQLYWKRAGFARNEQMKRYAAAGEGSGLLVAVRGGDTPGTRHMVKAASERGLAVFVYDVAMGKYCYKLPREEAMGWFYDG